MAAQPQPLPPEVYGIFSGPITADTVARIVNGLTTASASNVRHVHMLFHSTGGNVGDGVTLYNIFRTLPFELTLYNSGIVASIAVIAYLGGRHRVADAHATFMIHRTQVPVAAGVPAARMQTIVDGAVLDESRTEVFSENISPCPMSNGHSSTMTIFTFLQMRQWHATSRIGLETSPRLRALGFITFEARQHGIHKVPSGGSGVFCDPTTPAGAAFTHPAVYAIIKDCSQRRLASRKDSVFVLMIRLARVGARKQPHYRIVVIEKERARNGRPVEVVGTYNPRTDPASVELKRERVDYWVSKGAQVSDTVTRLLAKQPATAPVTA